MKKLLITLAASALIPAVAMAAELGGGLAVEDANSDGYYSFEEIHDAYFTATPAEVARADQNKDGLIVARELEHAVAAGYFAK
ncbi:MAG: hypothetical protein H5U19_09610 [Rhodobacteraceae bacterium]|nr:hypothetical protein [Paracoccaceae bacterium]